MPILVRMMLRVEGSYWGVLNGGIHVSDIVKFRKSCHDAFDGSLHWRSLSGELTHRQQVSAMGRKCNLTRIVISNDEWATSVDYGEMSHLVALEALGMLCQTQLSRVVRMTTKPTWVDDNIPGAHSGRGWVTMRKKTSGSRSENMAGR